VAGGVGSRGAAGGGTGDGGARRGDRARGAARPDAGTAAAPAAAHGIRKARDRSPPRRRRRGVCGALDALDGAGLLVRDAGVLDKTLHAEWQDALRAAARRLEAAWLALETGVAEERRRWAVETDAIARWRPSLWPVIVGLTPLAAGLIWLGLVLGGYLPAPAWLAGRLGF